MSLAGSWDTEDKRRENFYQTYTDVVGVSRCLVVADVVIVVVFAVIIIVDRIEHTPFSIQIRIKFQAHVIDVSEHGK